nr:PREDICTED: antitrypsin-like isoform X4 [Bemisia tabaci]
MATRNPTACYLLLTICLNFLVIMAKANPTEVSDVGFKNFVQSVNDIEAKLGKQLHGKDENSVICVPSAQILLGLLYAGAGGQTASELESLFGVDNKQLETLANFQKFTSHLEVPEIKIANTAYVAKDLELKKEFVEKGQKYFNVTVSQLDFTKKAEAAKTINSWVESKTEKLIKDLIKADDLSDDAKLVLLNAIYFKGKWAHPFKHHDTRDADFYLTKDKTIKVKQMAQTSRFQYAEDADYKYLIMPYKGSKLSMLIILPKDHETFEKKDISKANLSSLKFEEFRVQVQLPKFKIESTIDWIDILKEKIPTAFDGRANLQGISDTKLLVSKMIQKAFIKVDEEGTEAAAATAMRITVKSVKALEPVEKRFEVDRPFYYALGINWNKSRNSSEVPRTFLFQGVVSEPNH